MFVNYFYYLCSRTIDNSQNMTESDAYNRLTSCGIKPSVQRIAIMQYLLSHMTHPTVEEVYQGLIRQIPTLSRTTVYNTLRLFADNNAANMITIDEHRVCYDGNINPHVHFYCKCCKTISDIYEGIPVPNNLCASGNQVDDIQIYYKGKCSSCLLKKEKEPFG